MSVNLTGESKKLRKLFHDNQQTDRCQHPLNDSDGNNCRKPRQFEQAEDDLHNADNKDHDEQEFITFADMLGVARPPECDHHRHDCRCQTGRRTGDRHISTTDKREDKARDNRRNQPDDWWNTRGNCDA